MRYPIANVGVTATRGRIACQGPGVWRRWGTQKPAGDLFLYRGKLCDSGPSPIILAKGGTLFELCNSDPCHNTDRLGHVFRVLRL